MSSKAKRNPFDKIRAIAGVLETFNSEVVDEHPGILERMGVFVNAQLGDLLVDLVKWNPDPELKYFSPDGVSGTTKAIAYLLRNFRSREALTVEDVQGLGFLLMSLKRDYTSIVDWEHEIEWLVEQLSDIKAKQSTNGQRLGKIIWRLRKIYRNITVAKLEKTAMTDVDTWSDGRKRGGPAVSEEDALSPDLGDLDIDTPMTGGETAPIEA